jgi:hypothetical protein
MGNSGSRTSHTIRLSKQSRRSCNSPSIRQTLLAISCLIYLGRCRSPIDNRTGTDPLWPGCKRKRTRSGRARETALPATTVRGPKAFDVSSVFLRQGCDDRREGVLCIQHTTVSTEWDSYVTDSTRAAESRCCDVWTEALLDIVSQLSNLSSKVRGSYLRLNRVRN